MHLRDARFVNVGCIDMASLHVATSITELSHKYDIQPLFNEGIARLEKVVPRTLLLSIEWITVWTGRNLRTMLLPS